MFKFSRFAASALCLAFALSIEASAEDLIIKTDETHIIKIKGAPGTIVVGNPSIADATVENGRLFVQGKAFGSTNMIVLDGSGEEIANYNITVQIGGSNNVALFSGGPRYSYVCAPLCETTIMPGDPAKHVNDLISLTEGKSNLAKGISNQDSNGNSPNGGAPAQ
jgi:Pilus formation protein N terminal region